ncbi:autotransporter adhesin [Bradyrhizobium ottawaense]
MPAAPAASTLRSETAPTRAGNGVANTAVGNGSYATGANSSAFGNGASATFANSTAIGNGATATRANQQVYGTASNTYTMTGVTSAASAAAQSGPVQLVTTDAAGNLASTSLSALGFASPADIASINSQLAGINARLNDLDGRTGKAINGVAMAFAMSGSPWLMPSEKIAMSMNWGTFQNTNALSMSAALRVSEHVQASGGLTYGTNGGGLGGRVGMRVGW